MSFAGISVSSILGRALRLPLKLIPAHAQVRVIRGPLRGTRWIAESCNHSCWLGSYRHGKQNALLASIRRGDVVYDLGANVGFYSLMASVLVGPEGRVFSFEPHPKNLDFLHQHLRLNKVTNCFVLDVAVSDIDGTANFDVGPNLLAGHLTLESQNTLTVRTVALDSLVASGRLPPPDVIKCEIEGGEYDALRGASDTLATHAPTVVLTTHGLEVHEKCCTLLKALHYQLTPLDGLPLNKTREILATPPSG